MTQTTPDAVPVTARTRTETHQWWSRRPWLQLFLVPVAFVTYAFGHADEVVTAQRIFTAFVYGGVLLDRSVTPIALPLAIDERGP
jgi:hypothetical protein